MAKIYSGWKNDKEILSDLNLSSFKSYEVQFAYIGKDDDFVLLFKKGNDVYYTVGFLSDLPENVLDNLEKVSYNELEKMFGSEKWFKKNKVDIRTYFPMKESLVSLIKEGEDLIDEKYLKEIPDMKTFKLSANVMDVEGYNGTIKLHYEPYNIKPISTWVSEEQFNLIPEPYKAVLQKQKLYKGRIFSELYIKGGKLYAMKIGPINFFNPKLFDMKKHHEATLKDREFYDKVVSKDPNFTKGT